MKKCPNGMYSEIKYDGERVQVHKNGDNFSYFSRSLKPVLPHKVSDTHTHTHTPLRMGKLGFQGQCCASPAGGAVAAILTVKYP